MSRFVTIAANNFPEFPAQHTKILQIFFDIFYLHQPSAIRPVSTEEFAMHRVAAHVPTTSWDRVVNSKSRFDDDERRSNKLLVREFLSHASYQFLNLSQLFFHSIHAHNMHSALLVVTTVGEKLKAKLHQVVSEYAMRESS